MSLRHLGAAAGILVVLAACSTPEDYKRDLEERGFTNVHVSKESNDHTVARVTIGTCQIKLEWAALSPAQEHPDYDWGYRPIAVRPHMDFGDRQSGGITPTYLLSLKEFVKCNPAEATTTR